MVDPRIDVSPEENCALCGEPLLDEYNLILVESGRMEPMKRDPGFLKFVPDRNSTRENSSTLSVFHAHCFLNRFDQSNWEEGQAWACGWCERRFREGDHIYVLQVGTVDSGTLIFIPSRGRNTVSLMCTDCAYEGFGEGDIEEGMLLLEATG